MWEAEYPLIPGIHHDGSINAHGLQVILEEEKSAGRVSTGMTIEKVLRLEPVKIAGAAL